MSEQIGEVPDRWCSAAGLRPWRGRLGPRSQPRPPAWPQPVAQRNPPAAGRRRGCRPPSARSRRGVGCWPRSRGWPSARALGHHLPARPPGRRVPVPAGTPGRRLPARARAPSRWLPARCPGPRPPAPGAGRRQAPGKGTESSLSLCGCGRSLCGCGRVRG